MQQFYYFLVKKHKSKAEALRLTKLEFLRSGTELSHPRYWAAFVLNGEGAAPAPRYLSWQLLAALLLSLAAMVLVLLHVLRKKRSSRREALGVPA
jgi:CHAT domain